MLVFGAITATLFWSLAQLLGDYVDLWRSYREIILVFGSVTVRSHMFMTKLQHVITVCHCRVRDLIPIQSMWDLWRIKWY